MRKMKRLLIIPLSLLMIGIGIGITGCSKSEDSFESMSLDSDTLQVFDGLAIKFQMLNANKQPVTSFKEGEDITFKLVITNERDTTVCIPNVLTLLGENAFHIYTENAVDLDVPWDERYPYGLANLLVSPGQSIFFECPAFGEQTDISTIIPPMFVTNTWCIFYKTEARMPLSKGRYYTQFEINLNDDDPNPKDGVKNPSAGYKGVSCRKEFTIE